MAADGTEMRGAAAPRAARAPMTGRAGSVLSGSARRDTVILGVFLAFEVVVSFFFIVEAWDELTANRFDVRGWIEIAVAVALLLGILVGALALRRTLERMRAQEDALRAASGALSDVIAAQFVEWRLTPAERDVGMLALKGLDVAEIAAARGAAQGTVRAQLTSIYAKAGVSGRAQFAAFFVEDLLGGAV